ncbi:TRAP transporter small permease subunit [Marinobacterium sp. CAU 1594]|nr:TRAP transporter small permease subunit [Marinobacterium arenosum]
MVIILQVVLRKGFSSGLIALEELQWHLYALGVMFGLSYAQTTNSHIRVDLFYSHFRAKTKRIVEVVGILTLVLPFIAIVFFHSLDFLADSWRINEHSSAPSGLPWRWLIKGVIPISFALLALAMISRLIRDLTLLVRGDD